MASRDYEEFIAAFNVHGVRYLVVGAHAVALHARPRATRDLDILVDPTPANARRVLAALRDFFGGARLGYTAKDIMDPGSILQLGVAPVRIDLLNTIPGLKRFGAAWKNRVAGRFGSEPSHYLGLEDLVSAKRATSRPQDLADLKILERAQAAVRRRASRRSSRPRGSKA
jgi:hypothetical protein